MREVLKQKRNWILLCWPLGLICLVLVKNSREIAEYVFARGIYRVYGTALSFINGLLPFSVGEWLLILFCLAAAAFPVVTVILVIRRKKKLVTLVSCLRYLLIASGVVFLWFMIGAGTNYYRYEFSTFSGLEIKKSTVDELYDLCVQLTQKTNAAREELGVEEGKTFKSALTNRERAAEARKAMQKLSGQYDVLAGYYPYAKPVFFSRVLSEFNITGVYFPWTVEANVNVDTPDYSRGSVLCHELSHLRGFMREDEANFIGYLACVNSDCAELRYSGYMLALINAGNQLYSADKDKYYEVRALYSDGVNLDLKENSEYWEQFKDTALSTAGETMNNTYLKMNNVEDGTKSYGRMVDLLLAEWRKNKNGKN
ncbi:MAG: DUF3810 domain-containing protein [Lachnospiraceae bacterium]|nr:DUF3810 domain-containing protein [Lachnospiraceae bacterium]